MTPDDVAGQVVEAALAGRRLVLIQLDARLSWWASRIAPRDADPAHPLVGRRYPGVSSPAAAQLRSGSTV